MKLPPILFVDDSAVARFLIARLLAERGLTVTALASSEEAARVDPQAFAAALLDIELGDGFGTEVAARLRAGAPELPIAFLTAGGPAVHLDAARQLGPVFSKSSGVEDAVRWIAEAAARG